MSIARRAAAECIGTALLLAAIVGSGIMAERLASGNLALALLANSLATGGALVALILTFAPISGAQIIGAVVGVWLAHLMFDLPIIEISARERSGLGQWAGEFTASFGLIALIESGRRRFAAALPGAVAAYITAAYWFTSSTSFANPAVTLARSLSNTFAGIGPDNVPAFIAAQLAGAAAAIAVFRWFYRCEDVETRSTGR